MSDYESSTTPEAASVKDVDRKYARKPGRQPRPKPNKKKGGNTGTQVTGNTSLKEDATSGG